MKDYNKIVSDVFDDTFVYCKPSFCGGFFFICYIFNFKAFFFYYIMRINHVFYMVFYDFHNPSCKIHFILHGKFPVCRTGEFLTYQNMM